MESKYMEKLFTYAVYFLLVAAICLVALVGWDFTHGG